MCLSTVLSERNGADETLMKNVSGVRLEGDTIVFTDVMGRERTVRGVLKSLDFVENIIRVEEREA